MQSVLLSCWNLLFYSSSVVTSLVATSVSLVATSVLRISIGILWPLLVVVSILSLDSCFILMLVNAWFFLLITNQTTTPIMQITARPNTENEVQLSCL